MCWASWVGKLFPQICGNFNCFFFSSFFGPILFLFSFWDSVCTCTDHFECPIICLLFVMFMICNIISLLSQDISFLMIFFQIHDCSGHENILPGHQLPGAYSSEDLSYYIVKYCKIHSSLCLGHTSHVLLLYKHWGTLWGLPLFCGLPIRLPELSLDYMTLKFPSFSPSFQVRLIVW